MKSKRMWHTAHAKEFVQVFDTLAARKGTWNVWQDFVFSTAIALSNYLEPNEDIKAKRKEEYLSIAKGYSEDEMKHLHQLAQITFDAYEHNPQQDFLGELYMGMDFGSSWHGQYFTPWNVAYMMSQLSIQPNCELDEAKGYVSVCDPCCGSGCMLIAAAASYQGREEKRIYQNDMLFVGQDIDRVVALMCYIQLSALGCAGYVAVGNSISHPVGGHELFPTMEESGELWFTPMWYSPVWMLRRFLVFSESEVANKMESEGASNALLHL